MSQLVGNAWKQSFQNVAEREGVKAAASFDKANELKNKMHKSGEDSCLNLV